MTASDRLTGFRRACAATVFFLSALPGQQVPQPPSGGEIVAKMVAMDRARAADLAEYTSTRRYFLENTRFHTTAELIGRFRFCRPGRKEFIIVSESGSSVIRHKVLHRMVDSELEASAADIGKATHLTPDNYEFRLAGTESDRGRAAYAFDISPKLENKFSIRGRVWIDAEDFAITRVEGRPVKNPSFWIRSTMFVHLYQKLGPYWLAESNISQTEAVMFGRTSVEIQYTDYCINSRPAP